MAHKSNSEKFENMARVGNFTKNAVENFEENIVNKKNYLEEVSSNKEDYLLCVQRYTIYYE